MLGRDRASRSSSIRWVTRLSETGWTWPEPHARLREGGAGGVPEGVGARISEPDDGEDTPDPTPPRATLRGVGSSGLRGPRPGGNAALPSLQGRPRPALGPACLPVPDED